MAGSMWSSNNNPQNISDGSAAINMSDHRIGAVITRLRMHFGGTNSEGSPYGSDRQICADVLRALSELQDWRDSHRRIIDEPCREDERHCTCVPALRMEIDRLKGELLKAQGIEL